MSATPLRRRRLITMPADDAKSQPRPGGPLAPVIAFGVARQRLRGVTASRDMQYHRDPAS